jgi:hypothetical protein
MEKGKGNGLSIGSVPLAFPWPLSLLSPLMLNLSPFLFPSSRVSKTRSGDYS